MYRYIESIVSRRYIEDIGLHLLRSLHTTFMFSFLHVDIPQCGGWQGSAPAIHCSWNLSFTWLCIHWLIQYNYRK